MKNIIVHALILIVAYALLIFCTIRCDGTTIKEPIQKTDTITKVVVKHDTIRIDKPIPVETKHLTGVRVAKVPYIVTFKDKPDTLFVSDTIQVAMPAEQKVYTDDSTYTAWISGIQTELDSIHTYRNIRTETMIITKTITRKKNIGFGISAGGAITTKGFAPGISVGIVYIF